MNEEPLTPLNLPGFSFKVREIDRVRQIYDSVRKQYIVLTPEEWVRQNFIKFLTEIHRYPASLLAIEKMVPVNQSRQRADIVVYNKSGLPWLIVECKAPSVELSVDTFLQAARYNQHLKVNYFVLTNGLEHYCLEFTAEGIVFLDTLPLFENNQS
jgi:hypothetical protein